MKGFNTNNYVWVKLTSDGINQYRKAWTGYMGISASQRVKDLLAERVEGWSKFALHELMNYFGPMMYPGSPVPFIDNEIHFENPAGSSERGVERDG